MTRPVETFALIARRTLASVAVFAAAASGFAQASSTAAGIKPLDQVVQMSQFEVTTTQGHGYVSTNAASALKSNEDVMNIPQSTMLVTRDLIDNVAFPDTSNVLHYFGLSNTNNGEGLELRGISLGYAYTDDMPTNQNYADNVWVDSYVVIKGPVESLYMNAPLAGMVVKTSKKPLPYTQAILTGNVDNWGLYRFTADFTGPIGKVGDIELSYRVVGAYQDGDLFFYNYKDKREVIFPEFQAKYRGSTARIFYNLQRITNAHGYDLMTPSGEAYTGAGRREANTPPNDYVKTNQFQLLFDGRQTISDNWENRLLAMDWTSRVYEPQVLVQQGFDWGTQTEYFSKRLVNQFYKYWSVIDDTSGHYDIGPQNWEVRNVDTFGFGYSSWTNELFNWTTAPFGNAAFGSPTVPGQPAGTLAVAMNSVAAINAIHVPTAVEYPPPANLGTKAYTEISDIYWQHTTDIVPNWVTLVAGFTWENIATASVTNVSSLPFVATWLPASQWLHRLGAVFHVVKGVSLYALDSTSFTPAGSGNILENGQVAPNSIGTGQEYGVKFLLLGGRISGEAAAFRLNNNNVSVVGGTLANGLTYVVPIGAAIEEGVDGDVSLTIVPGWQLIGQWYAGHDRDQNNNPVSLSYDNSWSVFNRFDFSRTGPLKGLSIGGGLNRVGGRWVSDSGILDAPGLLPKNNLLKVQTGTAVDGFISYRLDRHWQFQLNANNILNQTYPLSYASTFGIDPSNPLTFFFETDYRF